MTMFRISYLRWNSWLRKSVQLWFLVLVGILLIICYLIGSRNSRPCRSIDWTSELHKRDVLIVRNLQNLNRYLAYYNNSKTNTRWPPQEPLDLLDPISGFYDLQLRPGVDSNPQVDEDDKILDDYWKFLKTTQTSTPKTGLSKLGQVVVMDRSMRVNSPKPNYQLYPQLTNIHESVENVRKGIKLKKTPINDPVLLVVLSPQKVCNPWDRYNPLLLEAVNKLIVIIYSCAQCFQQRQMARDTYMNYDLWYKFPIQFIFVIGLPAKSDQADAIYEKLIQEYYQNDDLLIGAFEDTFDKRSLKTMFAYRWAAALCQNQTNLYMFMSQDYGLVPETTMKFLRRLKKQEIRQFLAANVNMNSAPIRPTDANSKNPWAVSEENFPWHIYPPYGSSGNILIGSDLVQEVAIAMTFTKYFFISDVYVGIVLNKLDKQFVSMRNEFPIRDVNSTHLNDIICGPLKVLLQYYDFEKGKFKKPVS